MSDKARGAAVQKAAKAVRQTWKRRPWASATELAATVLDASGLPEQVEQLEAELQEVREAALTRRAVEAGALVLAQEGDDEFPGSEHFDLAQRVLVAALATHQEG